MRIQHNIPAMSAYRNYSNNTSALSKNLEKLSSGYKINRAGDDAAGLAISEKMRAQITGLEVAQKNAKDGISLVQTAEGALTEVHDMLNRMYELAEQSANGTYADEVDREQLQKEIVSLRTEIDRIADSSNFNGIKLLDGTMDEAALKKAADAQAAADAAKAAADAAQDAADNARGEVPYKDLSNEEVQDLMLDKAASGAGTVGTNTILQVKSGSTSDGSFSVNLDGISYEMVDGTATDKGIKIKIGNTELLITEKELTDDDYGEFAKGDTLNASDIAKAFVTKYGTFKGTDTSAWLFKQGASGSQTAIGVKIQADASDTDGLAYKVSLGEDGTSLKFDLVEASLKGAAGTGTAPTSKEINYQTSIEGRTDAAQVEATGASTSFAFTGGTTSNRDNTAGQVTATIDGVKMTFTTNSNFKSNSSTAVAAALNKATYTDADGKKHTLSDYFTVSKDGTTGIVFTDVKTGKVSSGNTIDSVELTNATGSGTIGTIGSSTTAEGMDSHKNGLNGYLNFGSETNMYYEAGGSDGLASTTLDISSVLLTDGAHIKLGDEEYIFALEGGEFDTGDANVITFSEDQQKATGADATTAKKEVASRLTQAAVNNGTFTVGQSTKTGEEGFITIKQKEAAKGKDMTTMKNFADNIKIGTADKEAAAQATAAAKAEAQAVADKAAEKAKEAQEKADKLASNKSLTLQIGDTADEFNQMTMDIKDMHAKSMKYELTAEQLETASDLEKEVNDAKLDISNIDISNQDDAAKAMLVIKNAINYVSDVRGDLGATQNRLDHTINNLSAMQENIQDAESTIRDVDVAKEMMEYTKNNILVQSAQAMLAQANQLPQGVLQLLQ